MAARRRQTNSTTDQKDSTMPDPSQTQTQPTPEEAEAAAAAAAAEAEATAAALKAAAEAEAAKVEGPTSDQGPGVPSGEAPQEAPISDVPEGDGTSGVAKGGNVWDQVQERADLKRAAAAEAAEKAANPEPVATDPQSEPDAPVE